MTTRNQDTSHREALNWLAIQYVLGELGANDALAFEERLAVDPLACAAVAEATQLTLTLQSVMADDVVVSGSVSVIPAVRSVTSTRGSWLALAGAATAAAGLLAVLSLGPARSRPESLAQLDRSASELVSLWRNEISAGVAFGDEPDAEVDESNHEVAVPAWLFTAVSLEQSKPIGETIEHRQEN